MQKLTLPEPMHINLINLINLINYKLITPYQLKKHHLVNAGHRIYPK